MSMSRKAPTHVADFPSQELILAPLLMPLLKNWHVSMGLKVTQHAA